MIGKNSARKGKEKMLEVLSFLLLAQVFGQPHYKVK
jgi:hypothetical protein